MTQIMVNGRGSTSLVILRNLFFTTFSIVKHFFFSSTAAFSPENRTQSIVIRLSDAHISRLTTFGSDPKLGDYIRRTSEVNIGSSQILHSFNSANCVF